MNTANNTTSPTAAELASMEGAMTNPTRSLGDAWFYALMTKQDDVYDNLQAAIEEAFNLAIDLLNAGLITHTDLLDGGITGAQMQLMAEARQHEDARFAKLLDITKARLLITVADHQTNLEMASRIATDGHPGEVALDAANSMQTSPSRLH